MTKPFLPFSSRINLLALAAGLVTLGCGPDALEPALTDAARNEVPAANPQALMYNGHDYLFIRSAKTWADARTSCESLGYGLVVINSAEEEAWLQGFEGSQPWWIGYTDQHSEGTWRWSTGSSSYTNWASGEPNDSNGEDCAVDNWIATRWNDLHCAYAAFYICESLP